MANDVPHDAPIEMPPSSETGRRLAALEARVAEQTRELDRLRRERRLYEIVTGQMCDGLSVIDQHFVIREANEAFVQHYGGDPSRVIGRTCHEVTHGSPRPCAGANHLCPVVEARRTGSVCRVEHLHRSEQGTEAIVEVTAIPVPSEIGQPPLVVEVAHDVTDRRRAEREAAERQRLEGVLATTGAACHHLSQPTQTLLLGLEQLRRRCRGLGSLETLVEMLQSEAERIAKVTRRLQHVARCVTVPYHEGVEILDLDQTDGIEPTDTEPPSVSTTSGSDAPSAELIPR